MLLNQGKSEKGFQSQGAQGTQHQGRKILFHFDLHSHSSLKNAFIYGNAFDQIVTQTESELYCKILEENCQIFKYGLSQFGERHMKMKDKG